MTTKPVVLLDVDGVLADIITASLPIVQRLTGRQHVHDDVIDWSIADSLGLTADQAETFYVTWRCRGFCRSIPPYAGAVAAIERLRSVAVVHPVTSPFNSDYWVGEREAWLQDHFGFDRKDIVHTEAKHLISGDVFIDDKPSHVVRWQKANAADVGVLWHQPYNQSDPWGGARARSWNDVITLVESL